MAIVDEGKQVVQFFKKYKELCTVISESEFARDMVMSTGGSPKSYANTQQYKVFMREACESVGFAFEASFHSGRTVNAVMHTQRGDRTTFLSEIDANFTLIDLATGYTRTYYAVGTAKGDAADHSALGAQTYAFRGWFLTNFLLNNAHDEKYERKAFEMPTDEGSSDGKQTTVRSKAGTSKTNTYAPTEMVADIGMKLVKLRETVPTAGDKFIQDFATVAEDGTFTLDSETIPYARAVSALQNIEEKLTTEVKE